MYIICTDSLARRRRLGSACFSSPVTEPGSYGWVPIQPSQPKQAIFRTGFDFTVFFSGILQFQLVRSLTRRWTYCINYVSQLRLYIP